MAAVRLRRAALRPVWRWLARAGGAWRAVAEPPPIHSHIVPYRRSSHSITMASCHLRLAWTSSFFSSESQLPARRRISRHTIESRAV